MKTANHDDHAERQSDGTWIAYGDPIRGETGYGGTKEDALADLRKRRQEDADECVRLDADEAHIDRICDHNTQELGR